MCLYLKTEHIGLQETALQTVKTERCLYHASVLYDFPNKLYLPEPNGKRPVVQPRTIEMDQLHRRFWMELHSSKMMKVMEDREVWQLNLKLLPLQSSRKSGQ